MLVTRSAFPSSQNDPGEMLTWKFIAAQGPLVSTIADFWTMVLENNCTALISLTRTVENNHVKCADYFSPQLGELDMYGALLCI